MEVEASIYCHDMWNPPAHDRTSDINLKVTNFGSIEFMKKGRTSSEAVYSLKIADAQSIGFTNFEQSIFRNEFNDFILAFNLVLPHVCVTTKSSEFSNPNIKQGPIQSTSNVVRKNNKVFVNIVEGNIPIYENIHIAVIHSTSVDGRVILEVFGKLQNIKRSQINKHSSVQDNNLIKSDNYENAMDDFDKILKFRHLFTALEKVTNIDGKDRSGDDFDKQVSLLYAVNSEVVKEWRHFYNRIKHAQKNSEDINTYDKGEKTLSDKLSSIRWCVQYCLLSKLK
jgi:hypothetical protein